MLRRILPATAASALRLAPAGSRGLWVGAAVAAYSLPGAGGAVLLRGWLHGRGGARLAFINAVLRASALGLIGALALAGLLGPAGYVALLAISSVPGLEFPDDEEQDGPEGCLSLPGFYFDTKRRLHTVARGFTADGDPVQVVGTGNLARCLQHETDHLDGVLFIDRMDTERRKAVMRALRRAEWLPTVKVSPHPMTRGYH